MKLNEIMEFDHVIQVHADGSVTEPRDVHAPEVNISCDPEGQISDADDRDMIASVKAQGWDLMTGYTGQHGYRGPIMHVSEYVGGGLERDILAEPGYYVVCEPSLPDHGDGEPVGWVIARKDA